MFCYARQTIVRNPTVILQICFLKSREQTAHDVTWFVLARTSCNSVYCSHNIVLIRQIVKSISRWIKTCEYKITFPPFLFGIVTELFPEAPQHIQYVGTMINGYKTKIWQLFRPTFYVTCNLAKKNCSRVNCLTYFYIFLEEWTNFWRCSDDTEDGHVIHQGFYTVGRYQRFGETYCLLFQG